MKVRVAITVIMSLLYACSPTLPYDPRDPNTRIIWCPECAESYLYVQLNIASFRQDIFDDPAQRVYHGNYCTILDTQTVSGYIWVNEYGEEVRTSGDVQVVYVECDLRFKRDNDKVHENTAVDPDDREYQVRGWTYPEFLVTVEEWDARTESP